MTTRLTVRESVAERTNRTTSHPPRGTYIAFKRRIRSRTAARCLECRRIVMVHVDDVDPATADWDPSAFVSVGDEGPAVADREGPAAGDSDCGGGCFESADWDSDGEYAFLVLPCADCGDLFPTRNELLAHRLAAHPGRRPHQCPACMAAFRSGADLGRHRRTHTAERPHACTHPGCSQRFSLPSHVLSHARAAHPHRHGQQYRCAVCTDRVFQSASSLSNHQRCHSDVRPFVCNVCKVTFIYRSAMSRHVKKHHTVQPCTPVLCK